MTFKNNIIRVGSRGSKLALVQIDEIKYFLKAKGVDCIFEQKVYTTQGDKDKTILLTDASVTDDFFTDTLDQAVLNNEIDIAIHSAKDLPQQMHKDIKIFALTQSVDETDALVSKVPLKDLPSEAVIGTSSILRQESIKELNPQFKIKDIRGTIQERIALMEEGKYDAVIIATIALKRLGLGHYIKNIMPWEGSALQGQLAITGRRNDISLQKLFSAIDVRQTYGKVVLVGAGPGDADLITLKGVNALKNADVVFYDYLVNEELLNHTPKAKKISAGRRKGLHSMPQAELLTQLRQYAIQGKTVVRLKGGDPFIFGRGAEEMEYLKSYHISVEIIPGVSSATAIPALLGIPLTDRNLSSSVAFISAHSQKNSDSKNINIPDVDTIVFLMGLTKLPEIIQSLQLCGRPHNLPIAIISKGTSPEEKVIYGTLSDIEKKVSEAKLQAPSLIIAGEVVTHGYSLHWN